MDILCRNQAVIDKAEELLLKYNLVIDGIECEITSVSIHSGNRMNGNLDPYVQNDRSRSANVWFPFQQVENKHNRYIDYDLTNEIEVNGIRINSLKSTKNEFSYKKTCGEVFDFISSVIVGESVLGQKGRSVTSNKKLFLKEKAERLTTKIYRLPRYGDFTKKSERLSRNLRHLFVTHLFTTDLEIFKNLDNPYEQIKIISLYLFLLGYEEDALQVCPTDEKAFKSYIRYMFKSSQHSPEALYQKCKNKTKLSIEAICKMFGYYCLKHHTFD